MKPRTKLLLKGGIALALLAGTVKKTQAELLDIANINKALIKKTPDQKDSIPTNPNREKAVAVAAPNGGKQEEEID